MQEKNERRRHFRLRFPLKERATLSVDGMTLEVYEVSESGLRLAMDKPVKFKSNLIKGDLCFADGTVLKVKGTVFRKEKNTIVLANVDGLSFKHLMQEQMRLLRKYPMLSF